MRTWWYILQLMVVIALIAAPVSGRVTADEPKESSYNVCVAEWSGSNTLQDLIRSENKTQATLQSGVFCGHFMSAEDLPVDNGPNDVAPTAPLFLAISVRIVGPVHQSERASIPGEHIPHSLHPEVAPHPPKAS